MPIRIHNYPKSGSELVPRSQFLLSYFKIKSTCPRRYNVFYNNYMNTNATTECTGLGYRMPDTRRNECLPRGFRFSSCTISGFGGYKATMKNFTKLLLGSLVLFSLSGCTAGDMITSYTSTSDQSETTLQNTSGTPKQRVIWMKSKEPLRISPVPP
mgnify:CR=1 FL=1